MAQNMILMALVVVGAVWNGAAAQSSCTAVIASLSPCLNFITGNSSTPAPMCCSQLNTVVQSQPQCLCSLLASGAGASLGIPINQTLALTLPGACNVQTPPLSQCNAAANGPAASAASPTSAPVGSPADSPPASIGGTPESPSTPSESDTPAAGGGSKTVPSTNGANSSGSTTTSPISVALFLVFIVSCVSTVTGF